MKKIVLTVAIIATIFLTGCGSLKDSEIRSKFIKDTEGLKSYYLEGEMILTNNDDTYKYDIEVSYKKGDNYKVVLTNKSNDYKQIILKNDDGVYVITPSLNKSFKFQSNWPNNNSQSYLLDSVAKDLKNDKNYKFTQKDNTYVFTVKTNYPNNPKYKKQNVILDKNNNLSKVEVQDDKGINYIVFKIKTIDKKAKFNNDQFSLEEITKDFKPDIEENEQNSKSEEQNNSAEEPNNNEEQNNQNNNDNNTSETSKIDENVFPLYLPTNTSLSDKEVIATENGERVIMTFSGDNPFILVEETVKPSSNLEIVPTYGEPFMLVDTVGSLTDSSYTWTSNGVEYYIVSDQMKKSELLEVAKSINIVSAINQK